MSHAATDALTRWRPRVSQNQDPVDLRAAERAAADLLTALGLPIGREAMAETPRRMAHAFAEMLAVPSFDFTTFANTEGYDEMVLVEDIPVRSLCEHLELQLSPTGVGVVVEAEHTCMSLRGVRAAGARTVTSALFGTLREDASARAEFLILARGRKEAR